MPSLPTKSWYSFSEGFSSPEEIVADAKRRGEKHIIFADSGEISCVRDILTETAKEGITASVGVEFLLSHEGRIRRVAAFARGEEGVKDLYALAATLKHPQDPRRPGGECLPGCEVNLPIGTLDDVNGKLLLVSGGGESAFEDCRQRGDYLTFTSFVDAARAKGLGVAAGYDPGMSDPRDAAFLAKLKSHGKPIPVIPWRWGIHPQGQEELYYSACRSVFGKSTGSEALRVGGAFGRMEDLARESEAFADEDVLAFTKTTSVDGKIFSEKEEVKPFQYKGKQGVLTQEQAVLELRERAIRNLDIMVSRSGVKGERAQKRRDFYINRIDAELEAIAKTEVAGRMLYVADLMDFCRGRGIKAMARGSAANSLVCYLNRISPVNPVTFDLPSERFINPRRGGTPDIDVDVAASRAEEARAFLCETGGGGVLLRSTVEAGFVDILQRELRSAGIPYGHELRERIRGALGGSRVPNTYLELKAEYDKFAAKDKDGAMGSLAELIASRFHSVNPETIEAAVNTARALEGRPFYNVEHVGVAMKPPGHDGLTPLLKNAGGKVVLAASHKQAEKMGFSKIDVLSRAALDLSDKIQSAVEKQGGKVRPISSVFAATAQPMNELRLGLTGGLDQIGPTGRSNIPHRQFLGSWEEDFTSHDLINYLALVRYGTRGWARGSRPEGEQRPRMLALYCGSVSANPALEELGKACFEKAAEDMEAGRPIDKWKQLAELDGKGAVIKGDMRTTAAELRKRLTGLPGAMARMETLGGGNVGGKLLARLTWRGEGDRKKHLDDCLRDVADVTKGAGSRTAKRISDFFGVGAETAGVLKTVECIAGGKAFQRPDYVTRLGPAGIEAWDATTSGTRGLLLFQEQVTDLLRRWSGCDYSTCDLVRDSIAHRDRVLPADVRTQIVDGINSKTGGGKEVGGGVIEALTNDAPYLFNKGHAAVYAGLISWQLENKKNWPASFALAHLAHARACGLKGGEAAVVLGPVLGDAGTLGARIDAGGISLTARSYVEEKAGTPGVLHLGIDAFPSISDATVARWEKLRPQLESRLGQVKSLGADELCKHPFGLAPEEAELVASVTAGGARAFKAYQKNLGFVPEALVSSLFDGEGAGVRADELNLYKPTCPKVSNAWGFVVGAPQISAGQGRRPCRVSCSLGSGGGRDPVEVSYVFWPERGKEENGFLPKEAVDLQARLTAYHQKAIPISTVIRLNDAFGRWDGSVTTIKTCARGETGVSRGADLQRVGEIGKDKEADKLKKDKAGMR